jgi:alpha-amylase
MQVCSVKRIYLGLAIHNHQPLGNFPWVFEDAYQRAYLPMLEALLRHPSISVALHYSGCLLDWLSVEHPEFFKLLSRLIAREQVEMLGGGYYEPILPMIPDADKLGQIGKMSEYIRREFGRRPRGLWLAERVWEPSLAKPLADAGINWTMVDDTAFKMVGRDEEELFGYFNTEEQGRSLKIFPISKYLRYTIPWHNVEDVMAYLKVNATESADRIAVLGDDGEKFGVWPQTSVLCWEEQWVERFFAAIEENAEWLSTIRLGDYIERRPPAGRIYLPCASYDEMLEWSLPADKSHEYSVLKHRLDDEKQDAILRYLYAGFWRNFLVKYPEVNRMHKKMLSVSGKAHRARERQDADTGLDYLWKAQCNCPYWHGVFGGIYLTDIRAEAYANLVKAENFADAVLSGGVRGYQWQQVDFDCDGNEELLIEGDEFNTYLSPAEGGTIFEWDLRRHAYNLLSTLSRKPEAYHKELAAAVTDGGENNRHCEDAAADAAISSLPCHCEEPAGDAAIHPAPKTQARVISIHDAIRVKDADIADWLIYDNLPRSSLIDRLLDKQVALEDYSRNSFTDAGDFAGRPYEFAVNSKDNTLSVLLKRRGTVRTGHSTAVLALEKTVTLGQSPGSLHIAYRFINESDVPVDTVFAGEWNINLLGGGNNPGAYYRVEGRDIGDAHLDSRGEVKDVVELIMGNSGLGIELALRLDRPLTLWRFPVECVSNSECGVEKVYQCSCVVILLPLTIAPGQEASFSYSWQVTK